VCVRRPFTSPSYATDQTGWAEKLDVAKRETALRSATAYLTVLTRMG